MVVAHPAGYRVHGHAGDLRAGGGQRGGNSHIHAAGEGGNGLLGIAGEHGGLFGIGQQVVGPYRRVAEALGSGVGLNACRLGQLLRLGHQSDGLQHIKAANGTACQMHLGTALHGSGLDLLVKIKVRKGTNGNNDQIHAFFQHRHSHGAHSLHRSSLHNVFRLQCQQSIHIIADGTAYLGGKFFCRSTGAAGHAHQLIVRQQTVLPCVGHNAAQKAAAYNAKFCFHILNSFFCFFQRKQHIPLKYIISKQKMI